FFVAYFLRMAVNEGDDVTVSLVDVLEEDEELENEASAVLGGSDPEKCSYPEGYVKRQALYACNTCTSTDKDKLNINNKYNHNFFGLYCTCERPYPDPEDQVPDEMIQCIICEDWFHGRHLGSVPVESIELQEMVCVSCMNRAPFLWAYAAQLAEQTPCVSSGEGVCKTAPSVTRLSPSKAEVEVNVEEDGQPREQESTGNSEEDKHSIKREGEQPSTSTTPEKAVTNGEAGCKRKYSQMEASADAKSEPVTCKLQELKAKGFVKKEGAIFWPYVWRSKLCTCSDCKKVYVEAGVPFLLDESDTVLAYEKKGKTEQESGLETRDPLMTALSSMGRVQQLELIYEYNDLKTELKDYLKRFADEGKVVTREDIQRFFEEFQSRKRRRMSAGQYYCA
ncbi:UBR7 ligase, partial [Atractosteus spatula]|nr:UBR7 ligase [Atractosteus spatula]